MARLIPVLAAGVALAAAAVFDLRRSRIPNWLTLSALLGALAARTAVSGLLGAGGLADGLVGALLAATVAVPMAVWGRMDWSDVKLLAAVGAFFSWPAIATALVIISVCAAAQAIVTLIVARARAGSRPVGIPFGVAIAAGSALAAWPIVHG
jgi:Flp pilus assembly protein protease CpaA